MDTSSEVREAVEAVIAEYERCWAGLDFAGLRELWDPDEPEPIYVAEELLEPAVGYPAIEAYWAKSTATIDRAKIRTAKLRVRSIAPGIALAFYAMHWNVAMADGRVMGGNVRTSALFRETPQGWRFFHYVEAPLANLVQVRQANEAQVDPDF